MKHRCRVRPLPPVGEPLRIAMSSYYLPSESKIGAGFQAHGLANAMANAGHLVTMFSPCAKPSDALYEHKQVEVRKPLATFRWAFALRRQDFRRFDVFHAMGDDYWFMGKDRPRHIRTMMGSCLSEAIHIRSIVERLRMLALAAGEALATLVADETVLISDNTRRWFPWVSTVIPCGVDTSRFHPGTEKEAEPTILFVGTFGNRKRGRMLMEAFEREVRPALPDARLWMVCSDAPQAPGVEVLGRISDEELAQRYRRAWVFCLPSSYEGFGVPYIEAMASGLPVVATPNAGAVEVLANGTFGIVSPEADLGRALRDLLNDEAKRDQVAHDALGQVKRYSWPRVVSEYESLYRAEAGDQRRSETRTRAQ